MARKRKKKPSVSGEIILTPIKRSPNVDEIRPVVQKGFQTGAQVADFVLDIFKLFS